jgi:hypothetical protein
MTRFEELPGNVRTLMLAKLAIEMRQLNALDLHHLALLRRVSITALWHGICRKASSRSARCRSARCHRLNDDTRRHRRIIPSA